MDRKLLNGRFKISAAQHQCSLCGFHIPIATRYKICTSVYNGRIYSFLICDICCKEIGYIKKNSGIDISNEFNYCIDDSNKEEARNIKKNNRDILNKYLKEYCLGKLGKNITEIRYNIQNNLIGGNKDEQNKQL